MDNQDMSELKKFFQNSSMRNIFIAAIILMVLFAFKPWFQVNAGERGIVLNFGAVQDEVLREGIHFRIPIMQDIIPLDEKIQKVTTDAASSSSDLQDVDLSVALNYHIIPEEANQVVVDCKYLK